MKSNNRTESKFAELKIFAVKYVMVAVTMLILAALFWAVATPGVVTSNYGKSALAHIEVDGKHAAQDGTVYAVSFLGGFTHKESELFAEKLMYISSVAKKGDKVVVHIESPGGAPASCRHSYDALRRVASMGVTIITSSDYMAASCGYMLMSAGDKVYSAPGARVGHIGALVMYKPAKLPIIGSSRMKELFAGDAPVQPGDIDILKKRAYRLQKEFEQVVLRLRGPAIKDANMSAAFSGELFNGQDALSIGLVDGNFSHREILAGFKILGYEIISVEYNKGLFLE